MCRKAILGLTLVLSLWSFLFPIPVSADLIETYAGNGAAGFSGDGVPATQTNLNSPESVSADGLGNLYIADTNNHRIRKVDSSGVITTVAGIGSPGYSSDGGPATQASIAFPGGVLADGLGSIYIADTMTNRIRKVDGNGIITTVAGNGIRGFSGDGGPATQASLYTPVAVAVDGLGNLYIADYGTARVRKVDVDGIITTVAGNGTTGFFGDGGPATQAILCTPAGVSADGLGNLYIADGCNSRIRKVDVDGIITTVAGNGSYVFSGDGGPATQASLSSPGGVTADGLGNFYLADSGNSRIRKVDGNGIITTVAGNGSYNFSGDGGPATQASLNWPHGVAMNGRGNLYIADLANHRIRRVNPLPSVTSTDPANGAANVPLNRIITVTFSEDIQVVPPQSNIVLFDEKRLVPVQRTVSVNGNILTIKPSALLKKAAAYSVSIPAFSIKDLAGNEMESDKVFYFTTVRR